MEDGNGPVVHIKLGMTLLGEVFPSGCTKVFPFDVAKVFIYSNFVGSVGLSYILFVAFSACD